MMQISRVRNVAPGQKDQFQLVSIGKEHSVIATFDSIEKAGCVLRFLHGANIKGDEYTMAVEALRMIDINNARDAEAKTGTSENAQDREIMEIREGVEDHGEAKK